MKSLYHAYRFARKRGRYAGIVAVDRDSYADVTTLERVKFVMKGGKVYKQAANPLGEAASVGT